MLSTLPLFYIAQSVDSDDRRARFQGLRAIMLYQGIFSIRRTLKTLRDQELCVTAHLFAEEVNTQWDLVGENLATKGDEPYFKICQYIIN